MKKDELKEKEEHKCVYDQIIIRKGEDPSSSTSVIRVYTDCSCLESAEKPLVTFHENKLLGCDNNFKGWFQSVVGYFVQNDFKIKDLR